MPLVGTICCQDKVAKPFSECITNCREGACKHPLPLLVNMSKNAELRRDVGISSSTLGGCPRQYLLGRKTDYYEDPEDYYARWFGSFGHYAIEMDGPYPGVIQEVRFRRWIKTPEGEVEISGQPDWIDVKLGHIIDHKMVGRKPSAPRQEHIAQLNVYRWLVEGGEGHGKGAWPAVAHIHPHGFIKKLMVQYFHPGANGRHTEYEVPIWSDEDVEIYIRSRVRPLQSKYPYDVGIYPSKDQQWRYNYCPWRHECNVGTCCMAPLPF